MESEQDHFCRKKAEWPRFHILKKIYLFKRISEVFSLTQYLILTQYMYLNNDPKKIEYRTDRYTCVIHFIHITAYSNTVLKWNNCFCFKIQWTGFAENNLSSG